MSLDEILSNGRTEYVSKEAREEFVDSAEITVVEKSALKEDGRPALITYSFPTSTEDMSDEDLITKMKEVVTADTADIQTYQLRVDDMVATKIEVQRHPNGMSAYAKL